MAAYTSRYTDKQIYDNIKKFYDSLNTVNISSISNASISMSKDNVILNAVEKNGVWTFHPNSFGVWTIIGMLNQTVVSTDINVDSIGIKAVSLSFN